MAIHFNLHCSDYFISGVAMKSVARYMLFAVVISISLLVVGLVAWEIFGWFVMNVLLSGRF